MAGVNGGIHTETVYAGINKILRKTTPRIDKK
jgi:hypothetical protein